MGKLCDEILRNVDGVLGRGGENIKRLGKLDVVGNTWRTAVARLGSVGGELPSIVECSNF